MNCLVTGGAGFIGSHLVDRLISDGHKVVIIDNFINGRKENLQQHKGNKNLKIFCQSVTEDLTDVFGKVEYDCVFHLAALPRLEFSIDYPIEAHNVNINGTLNLLQACRSFGAKRFIFSSSSSIYGKQKKQPLTEDMVANDFLVPYALQKITGEHYCKLYFHLYGLKTIVLRYFSVYGPRQNPASPYSQLIARSMARAIKNDLKDRPFITGDGNQARAFTFVSDVVEANILASKASEKSCFGEPFNVGNPSEVTVNQVIKKILTISKSKLKPEYRPARIEPAHILPDITKSKRFLGWEAKISFDEGIEKVYQSFLQG
jgi:nucleoside-diphosphate-sugar epimerase